MFPCPSKYFFNVDCLGCGGQRALVLLLQGDWVAAFNMYPPIFTVIPWALFFCYSQCYPTKVSKSRLRILTLLNCIVIPISYIFKHI
ncbi:DUF2752 domain-containing protein [Flavobacterium sp.]|uniref:DUF2752 domain-containing protein n=1 Tax=Flavobacterium sp. TaxID=239 RepID=UPI003D0E33A3